MTKVLVTAGHVNIGSLTGEHLRPWRGWQALRSATGSRGEREWTGDAAQRLTDALRVSGVDARFCDAVWNDAYETFAPDLVFSLHFHRDGGAATGAPRAMFCPPETAPRFHSPAASAESFRLVERIANGYTQATSIPVTQHRLSDNMLQLYTWDYLLPSTQAVIAEVGNMEHDLDRAVAYEPGIARITRFLRDCILEHFNLAAPIAMPARRESDTRTPARADGPRSFSAIALELEYIAGELRRKEAQP